MAGQNRHLGSLVGSTFWTGDIGESYDPLNV